MAPLRPSRYHPFPSPASSCATLLRYEQPSLPGIGPRLAARLSVAHLSVLVAQLRCRLRTTRSFGDLTAFISLGQIRLFDAVRVPRGRLS